MPHTNIHAAPVVSDQLLLALDRTYLAHERTLMAWIRTATSLITFGFTLYKFFFYMREQGKAGTVEHMLDPRGCGLVMIGLGVFMLLLATVQHRQAMHQLRLQKADIPWSLSALMAAIISLLGLMAFFAAIFRW